MSGMMSLTKLQEFFFWLTPMLESTYAMYTLRHTTTTVWMILHYSPPKKIFFLNKIRRFV